MKTSYSHRITSLLIPVTAIIAVILLVSFRSNPVNSPSETCITIHSGQWGKKCNSDQSYEVQLRNDCMEAKDIKGCVKRKDGTWSCYVFTNVQPGESKTVYTCTATGDCRYWYRKAGDYSVTFPTTDEINSNY